MRKKIKLTRDKLNPYQNRMKKLSAEIRELLDKAEKLKFDNKHKEAISVCEEILSLEIKCVEAYEEIGDNYISLGELKKAEKALLEALKINPDSANASYLLGFLYSCQRNWKQSIDFLERSDGLKPNHPEILRCLGWSYAMEGKTDRGIILLERAKTLAPDDVYILTDLGVCYLNKKDIKKALPIFRKVLDLDPENKKARECLLIVEEYAAGTKKIAKE